MNVEFSFTVVIAKKDDKLESLTCDIENKPQPVAQWARPLGNLFCENGQKRPKMVRIL